MERFLVLRDEISDAAARLSQIYIRTERIADRSLRMATEIGSSNQAYSDVSEMIRTSGHETNMDSQCLRALSNGLEEVVESYEITEKQVAK